MADDPDDPTNPKTVEPAGRRHVRANALQDALLAPWYRRAAHRDHIEKALHRERGERGGDCGGSHDGPGPLTREGVDIRGD